jgi:hypothetical protein
MGSTASPIFAVSSPTCADELTPVSADVFRCGRCPGRHRINGGYLEAIGATPGDKAS